MPVKVLVVDDFEPFRRFIRTFLQRRPEFQVIGEAADGLEAVQKAKELQPDLILLDIGLPNLDGMAVAKQIPTLAPHAKLLFVSETSSAYVVLEALRLGAQGYVYKRRAQRDLMPAIEAVFEGRQFVSGVLELSEGTHNHGRHEVFFYSNDPALLDGLSGFIATALNTGNTTIALATKSHREDLTQRLKQRGLDIGGAVQQGTYIELDSHEMLSAITPNGVPDLVRFSEGLIGLIESAVKGRQRGSTRTAICGECLGPLCAAGNTDAAIQFEKISGEVAKTHDVDILCGYQLSCFDDQELKSICAVHTGVYFP